MQIYLKVISFWQMRKFAFRRINEFKLFIQIFIRILLQFEIISNSSNNNGRVLKWFSLDDLIWSNTDLNSLTKWDAYSKFLRISNIAVSVFKLWWEIKTYYLYIAKPGIISWAYLQNWRRMTRKHLKKC